MVVNQLNGIFHVKNQDIAPIYNDIQQKLSNFDAVSFTHVPRSKNMIADSEANAAIDEILNKWYNTVEPERRPLFIRGKSGQHRAG